MRNRIVIAGIVALASLFISVEAMTLNKVGTKTLGADGQQSQTRDALHDGPCDEALNMTAESME